MSLKSRSFKLCMPMGITILLMLWVSGYPSPVLLSPLDIWALKIDTIYWSALAQEEVQQTSTHLFHPPQVLRTGPSFLPSGLCRLKAWLGTGSVLSSNCIWRWEQSQSALCAKIYIHQIILQWSPVFQQVSLEQIPFCPVPILPINTMKDILSCNIQWLCND